MTEPLRHTVTLLEDPQDPEGAILPLPDELAKQLGWREGDTLQWAVLPNGGCSISNPDADARRDASGSPPRS